MSSLDISALYQPSRDQRSLAEAFAHSIAPLLPIERLHQAPDESDAGWSALAELGLFEMGVAETDGGLGLGAAEEALVAIVLGRCLASPSVLATLCAAHARYESPEKRPARVFACIGDAAVDGPQQLPLFQRLQEGAQIVSASLAGPPQPVRHWLSALAPFETTARIGWFAPADMLRVRLIEAASLAGLADAACAMAVAYAQMREQFGRPIGSFQAIKHSCASMAIAAQSAQDLVTFAAIAVDNGREDAPVQVEAAWVAAAQSALDNAGANIQVHGGIGFSDEAAPHLFIKRAQLLVAIGGGLEPALQRLSQLPGA